MPNQTASRSCAAALHAVAAAAPLAAQPRTPPAATLDSIHPHGNRMF
jgi:hypothetical protein